MTSEPVWDYKDERAKWEGPRKQGERKRWEERLEGDRHPGEDTDEGAKAAERQCRDKLAYLEPSRNEIPMALLSQLHASGSLERAGVVLSSDALRELGVLIYTGAAARRDVDRRARTYFVMSALVFLAALVALTGGVMAVWDLGGIDWFFSLWIAMFAGSIPYLVAVMALLRAFPRSEDFVVEVASAVAGVVGLAAGTYVFSVPFPGTFRAVIAVALLGSLLLPASYICDAATRALATRMLRPDMRALLSVYLLESSCALIVSDTRRNGAIWPGKGGAETSTRASDALDQAARWIERYPPWTVPRAVAPRLRRRAQRVDAWLRARQADLADASSSVKLRVTDDLIRALAALAVGDWTAVEAEPGQSASQTWLRRLVPRAAAGGVFVGAAVLAPTLFGGIFDAAAVDRLQVVFVIGAVTAIITPPQLALSGALNDLRTRVAK